MRINLNDPNDFTLENVKKLIASKDDSKHRQIRVSTDGYAYVSDDYGNLNLDGVVFRLETFNAHNDYLGEQAAEDKTWVQRVYNVLRQNWPNPIIAYSDDF
jgi:hypothetical protein